MDRSLDRSGTFLHLDVIADAVKVPQSTTTRDESAGCMFDDDGDEGRSELMSLTLNDNDIDLICLDETTNSADGAESDEDSQVVEDFADVEAGVFWGKVTEAEIELERKYLAQTGYNIESIKPQMVQSKRKRTSITGQPKYLPLLATKSVSSKFWIPIHSSHTVNPANNFVTPRWSPSGRNCPRSAKKNELAKPSLPSTVSNTSIYVTPRTSPSGRNNLRPTLKSSAQLSSATNNVNNKRPTFFNRKSISKPSLVTTNRRRSSVKPSGITRQNTYTVLPCAQTPKWNIRPLSSSTPFH